MKNLGKAQRTSSYDRLLNLTREFADAQAACDLLDDFLRRKSYERSFCVRLLAVATAKEGPPLGPETVGDLDASNIGL